MTKCFKSLSIAVAVLSVGLVGCSQTSSLYSYKRPIQAGEVQIAGHPYRSMADCSRNKPIGKFDLKCDVPYVGIGGGQTFDNFNLAVGGGGSGTGN